jgi:hypothetical protein
MPQAKMNALNSQAGALVAASGRLRTWFIAATGIEKQAAAMTATAATIGHNRPGDQVKQSTCGRKPLSSGSDTKVPRFDGAPHQ